MRTRDTLCYGVLKNRTPFDPEMASKKPRSQHAIWFGVLVREEEPARGRPLCHLAPHERVALCVVGQQPADRGTAHELDVDPYRIYRAIVGWRIAESVRHDRSSEHVASCGQPL